MKDRDYYHMKRNSSNIYYFNLSTIKKLINYIREIFLIFVSISLILLLSPNLENEINVNIKINDV